MQAFIARVYALFAQLLGNAPVQAITTPLELFDALPREAKIELLMEFDIDEIETQLCRINRKYKRILCGEMEPSEIPDSEIIYEHWQRRLERDYGISRNLNLCRGDTLLERQLVHRALNNYIPPGKRLNMFLNRAHASMCRGIKLLHERPLPPLGSTDTPIGKVRQIHGVFGNLLFYSIGEVLPTTIPQRVFHLEMCTTLDFAYAQIFEREVNSVCRVIDRVTLSADALSDIKIAAPKNQSAVFFINTGRRTAYTLHLFQDTIITSMPTQLLTRNPSAELFRDPFEPMQVDLFVIYYDSPAVLNQADGGEERVHYRLNNNSVAVADGTDAFIKKAQWELIERVVDDGKPLFFGHSYDFERFSLSIEDVRIVLRSLTSQIFTIEKKRLYTPEVLLIPTEEPSSASDLRIVLLGIAKEPVKVYCLYCITCSKESGNPIDVQVYEQSVNAGDLSMKSDGRDALIVYQTKPEKNGYAARINFKTKAIDYGRTVHYNPRLTPGLPIATAAQNLQPVPEADMLWRLAQVPSPEITRSARN